MGWIYDISYKGHDGKPIKVKGKGSSKNKDIPGAIVSWIDSKSNHHHEAVPIYVKGDLKNKPKTTVHGCLNENREPILKISGTRAEELVSDYNSALRRYKKNPKKYGFLKTGKALNEDIREKAEELALRLVKYEKDRRKSIQGEAKELSKHKGTIIYNDAYEEGGKGKMRMAIGGMSIKPMELQKISKRGNRMMRNHRYRTKVSAKD